MTCSPGPGRSAGPGPPTLAASHRLRRRPTRRVGPGGEWLGPVAYAGVRRVVQGLGGPSSPPVTGGLDPSCEALDDGCLFPLGAARWRRARCRGWPASGPGRLAPAPWFLPGLSVETSGVKCDSRERSPGTIHLYSLPCGHCHAGGADTDTQRAIPGLQPSQDACTFRLPRRRPQIRRYARLRITASSAGSQRLCSWNLGWWLGGQCIRSGCGLRSGRRIDEPVQPRSGDAADQRGHDE